MSLDMQDTRLYLVGSLTIACCSVLGIGLGLDLMFGWLVVMPTYLYFSSFRCHWSGPCSNTVTLEWARRSNQLTRNDHRNSTQHSMDRTTQNCRKNIHIQYVQPKAHHVNISVSHTMQDRSMVTKRKDIQHTSRCEAHNLASLSWKIWQRSFRNELWMTV